MSLLRRIGVFGIRQIRPISKSSTVATESLSVPATESLSVPIPEKLDGVYSAKIENLVSEISHLTLLEVSELSTALKLRLNLPDAPVMPMMSASAPKAEEEEAPETKAVKTLFTVKLMKYDDTQKIALIKECKNLLEGMNLVQAKKFVESAPCVVKDEISKDEADQLKEALTKVGAEVVIE